MFLGFFVTEWMKNHLNKKMVLFIEIIPYIEFIYHIDMFHLNQNLLL